MKRASLCFHLLKVLVLHFIELTNCEFLHLRLCIDSERRFLRVIFDPDSMSMMSLACTSKLKGV
ncbi:hypothetical protein SAMN04488490_0890 [Marinobacter sp. LV10R510-11A]|nr:hypothetical protein SAMN04488490_0890 [Marinobacter sp. LV10R510-11A]